MWHASSCFDQSPVVALCHQCEGLHAGCEGISLATMDGVFGARVGDFGLIWFGIYESGCVIGGGERWRRLGCGRWERHLGNLAIQSSQIHCELSWMFGIIGAIYEVTT